ncbi:MAG TPA: aminotransferase class V-fold PLP-dependent enzyme, partial [Anaerovoracaceae bacterium]|nr:aminotransferase class V-fold PLP-dependent enzyme [Anaerovoracaceae bacterium]
MQVYADNAATTKVSQTAIDALLPCLTDKYGNPSSIHGFGQAAARKMENAR